MDLLLLIIGGTMFGVGVLVMIVSGGRGRGGDAGIAGAIATLLMIVGGLLGVIGYSHLDSKAQIFEPKNPRHSMKYHLLS